MVSLILPNPGAVSVPFKQRGVPHDLYLRTYWNLAPERVPEPTRSLPPISELIASLRLSEPPPTTGDILHNSHPSFASSSSSSGSVPPSSPASNLPSILELRLPDPFPNRKLPPTITPTITPTSSSNNGTPRTERNAPSRASKVTNTTPAGIPHSPVSPIGNNPQAARLNVVSPVTTVQRPSATRIPRPFDARTDRTTPVTKPRRRQGQRSDLILAKRKKPGEEDDAQEDTGGSAFNVVEEQFDIDTEGKGWSTDGNEYAVQRFTLAMREKKHNPKKKRRSSSDPYPGPPTPTVKQEEGEETAADILSAAPPKRADKRGRRFDLQDWRA